MITGCSATNTHVGNVATRRNAGFPAGTILRVSRAKSGAMEPTLPAGTRVTTESSAPAVGDIVVVHPPEDALIGRCGPKPHVVKAGGEACETPIAREAARETIERVVAAPGDEIYVSSGHVYRRTQQSGRFTREADGYIRSCGHSPMCDYPVPIKIPAGHWFLMGDNRGKSIDSRSWGPVPGHWVVGVAIGVECRRISRHRLGWVRRTWQQGCRGVEGGV